MDIEAIRKKWSNFDHDDILGDGALEGHRVVPALCDEVEHLEEFKTGYALQESWWLKRQEALTLQIAVLESLVKVHYLPMDCPVCGRRRLEYDRRVNLIKCEKCGAANWEKVE
jgi:ribosomal protein S27E